MKGTVFRNYLAVFLGGCFGGIARYGLSMWINDAHTMLGTTVVNVVGSFLLTFITYGIAVRYDVPDWLILGLGTGFVGAFTTFSTLGLNLVRHVGSEPILACAIFALNLLLGLLASVGGYWVGQLGERWRRGW